MRILTGSLKNRAIVMPKGIRPTQQKVRKAVFDILAARIPGSAFLELFAGSGAVGIEAASNAAAEVVFVEQNPACLRALRENIAKTGMENGEILALDALDALGELGRGGAKFDIIFLDPPYAKHDDFSSSLAKKTLLKISAYDIVKPIGFVVVQHCKEDELPDSFSHFILYKRYQYSETLLSLYQRGEHVPEGDLSGKF